MRERIDEFDYRATHWLTHTGLGLAVGVIACIALVAVVAALFS